MNDSIKKIYNKAFDLVERTLSSNREVYPFIVLENSGSFEVKMQGYVADQIDLIESLKFEIQDSTKPACACYTMSIVDPRDSLTTDAVIFEINDNMSIVKIALPYKKKNDNTIEIGQSFLFP